MKIFITFFFAGSDYEVFSMYEFARDNGDVGIKVVQ